MAPRPEPVTTDWQVCKAMRGDPPDVYAWKSNEVAEVLGLTVFQITARLKAMSGRQLVAREMEYWQLTDLGVHCADGPEPPKKEKVPLGDRVYRTPTGGVYSPGGPRKTVPEDPGALRLPRGGTKGWRMRYAYGPKNPKTGFADIEFEVFIDLDGNQYVRAEPFETADVLVECPVTTMRLCKMNGYTAKEKTMDNAYRLMDIDKQWRTRNE